MSTVWQMLTDPLVLCYAALSPWHWKTPANICPTSPSTCTDRGDMISDRGRVWAPYAGFWKVSWARRRVSRQVWWEQGRVKESCIGWSCRGGPGEGCGKPWGLWWGIWTLPLAAGELCWGVWAQLLAPVCPEFWFLLCVVTAPRPWASGVCLGGQQQEQHAAPGVRRRA